jgi:16S rRNA G527 N7-methylase RsmG
MRDTVRSWSGNTIRLLSARPMVPPNSSKFADMGAGLGFPL